MPELKSCVDNLPFECREILIGLGRDIMEIKAKTSEIAIRQKEINGKYDKHIEESINYRIKIEQHDLIIDEMNSLKRLWWGAIITMVASLLSIAVMWGGLIKQVSVNTGRLNDIELLHPRN